MSLSVLSIVGETFSEVGKHRGVLARALFFPASLLALMEVEPGRMADFSFVWAFLLFPVLALFMVSCHRIILLGPTSLPNPLGVFWGARETKFLGWLLVVTLILALFLVALIGLSNQSFWVQGTVGWLLQLMLIFPALYLVSRVSLVLPKAAVDERPELGRVWALSRGNGWRLTIALLLFPLAGIFLRNGLEVFWGLPSTGPEGFVVAMVSYLLVSFEVVALAVAYRTLNSAEESS